MQASIAQNTAACEEVSKQIEDMQEVSMCISICVIYNASGELKLAYSPKARSCMSKYRVSTFVPKQSTKLISP